VSKVSIVSKKRFENLISQYRFGIRGGTLTLL
jgi:hypothetical protein